MRYRWATATDVGRVRSVNEDAVRPDGDGESDQITVAVADGMGGHIGGEVASRLAIEAAMETDGEPVVKILRGNDAVVDRVMDDPYLAGMGTTLTIAELAPDGSLSIGHIGDSRAYLLRHEALEQLTRDHSVVAELLANGKITEDQAATHPYRSIITKAIGVESTIEPDAHRLTLEPGDVLLLCSDGLSNMVEDESIADLIASAGEPRVAVASLVEAALEAGGQDNITVAVVEVLDDE